MAIIFLVLLSAMVPSLYADYNFVRKCRAYTEVCMTITCGGNKFVIPTGHNYICCKDQIADGRNYVCTDNTVKKCDPCDSTSWQCGSGQCIRKTWRCDGDKDCFDGTDEIGCAPCGPKEFRCKNKRCIKAEYVCNTYNWCGDGSDESNCPKRDGGFCGYGLFRCINEKCIDLGKVCDNVDDCGDDSDEKFMCPNHNG